MNSTLSKILQALLAVLLIVSVILVVIFYSANSAIAPDADFATQIIELGSSLELYMLWAYLLLFVAAAGAIVFPLISMITNPKGAIKTLLSIAFFAVVIIIAYTMADDTVLNIPGYTGSDNVPSMLKIAGTSIYSMYFLIIIAVGAIFYAEISKMLK